MILVALAMVAIIAMAALSIDVITLYLAREEAQRSADQAALAAARVISLSGMMGDPGNVFSSWQAICGGATSPASQVAIAVAQQSAVGGTAVPTPTVTYSAGTGGSALSSADCSGLPPAFAVNPMVTVQFTRPSLPTFFSRIWGSGGSTVSASATAEAFNPSNSGNVSNGPTGTITPVQPRCVKPWLVPNLDPLNGAGGPPIKQKDGTYLYCNQAGGPGACLSLVSAADGSITHPGISLTPSGANGIIGESFWISPDCVHTGTACGLRQPQPGANYVRAGYVQGPPNLQFVPGADPPSTPVAVPSWATGMDLYEQAIAGCDQSTVYQCGVQSTVELGGGRGNIDFETADAVLPLIREADLNMLSDGQDSINSAVYPFQILAGTATPLSGLSGNAITSSTSVVSLPIYDSANTIAGAGTSPVTIVGFLQVFMNQVDQYGNVSVTILNVAGCGNGAGTPVGSTPITGSSPVPVRLITPP
jgi:hypothetical protein